MCPAYFRLKRFGFNLVKVTQYRMTHNHRRGGYNEIQPSLPDHHCDLTADFLSLFPKLEFATFLDLNRNICEFEAVILCVVC